MHGRLPTYLIFTLLALLHVGAVAVLSVWLAQRLPNPWLAALAAVAIDLPVLLYHIHRAFAPMSALFRALAGTVANYRDGDYNFSLAADARGELAELVAAHNEMAGTLREQRLAVVQRELLLDTMVQNTPVSMLLVDPSRRIVHANLAARTLLGDGRKLDGHSFDALMDGMPEAMRDAIARGGDGLFSVGDEDSEDIYHLSRRRFRLNGRSHELVMLRQLTAELRRQEVQTWKKVIRVISHELNNSLAPIASLAHSGAELLRRGQLDRLPLALATIEERARHLEGFIRDYGRFAKLPAPRREPVAWSRFIEQLRSQIDFRLDGTPVDDVIHVDPSQLEQCLLNLLRNAHESGSDPEHVRVSLRRIPQAWRIDVLDRGSGMNDAALANALLPFYSTKRHGTGLGLALAREIAEAHGGRVALLNREGGGLCVSLVLPDWTMPPPAPTE